MKRVRVRVCGRVQGVFFRATCAERARSLGLGGWARNLPGGDVEAVFEGPDSDVDKMIAWCRQGPSQARVDDVEVSEESVEGIQGFHITG